MKSKTKIERQLEKKTNSELVDTIIKCKKNPAWIEVAAILSGPRRKNVNLNLNQIEANSKIGETIIVPGKVLSLGEINKKMKIVAMGFSEKAIEKLKKANCEIAYISEEIDKNKQAKGVKILK